MAERTPSDRTLVVADDLTGATDTGHGFAARGFETVVRLDPEFDAPDAAVLVVDTDSRYADPDEAGCRVRDAVASVDAAVVYKKVDSTLRGNLASEIEAAMDAMEADVAAVAPAFPSNGRTTACGYHLVHGALVTDTEAGNDPDSPVLAPRLPDHLRERGASDVRHVGVERVASGDADGLRSIFDTDGLVTFDAVDDAHLDTIAEAVDDSDERVLLVGCGGLAEHVRIPADATAERAPADETPTGTAFGVAGSVSAQTFAQLDALPDEVVLTLDAARAVDDVETAATDATERCRDRFGDADVDAVVLASARDRSDVDRVLDAADDSGVDERIARERVTEALAVAARRVWDEAAPTPGGLFLTGGAVAKAVLGELETDGLALRGEEVSTGVPVSEVRGGIADGTPLVTKAGAFGIDSTIADALDHVRRVPTQHKE